MQLNYSDDEVINVQQFAKQAAKMNYDLENQLSLTVLPSSKVFKLSSTQSQIIPVEISVKTTDNVQQEQNFNSRPSIDLICVIDKSGSMQGEKIELLKETLKQLLEFMNDNDRICLVQFDTLGQRCIPLTSCKQNNQSKIIKTIERLNAGGGTNITEGLKHAFQVIQQRKIKNQVTSIFLLTDGQDSQQGAQERIKKLIEEMKFEETLTIHSFGFGDDHDPVLMDDIAKLKDGNFYYVQELKTIDEMFVDALGGLFSVVAQNVEIRMKVNHENKLFLDNQIKKTYGDMWKYNKQTNEYSFKLVQLISGVRKDFILELEVPAVLEKIGDNDRNTVFLNAYLTASGVGEQSNKILNKQAGLEITIYNEDENVVSEINESVQTNLLRVKGAEAIKLAMESAESGDYQEGQNILNNIQQNLNCQSRDVQNKLQQLQQGIQFSISNCQTKNQYQQQGRNFMVQNIRSNFEQRSCGIQGQSSYSNNIQQNMISSKKQKQTQSINDQYQQGQNYYQQVNQVKTDQIMQQQKQYFENQQIIQQIQIQNQNNQQINDQQKMIEENLQQQQQDQQNFQVNLNQNQDDDDESVEMV